MTKTRAPRRPVVLLRPVPGTSTIHELWAGTKLIAVFLISVLLTFFPTWTAIGAVAALVILTAWLAHIPRGAVPTIPIWMVALVIGGSLTVFFSGGPPFWHIGGLTIGFHGVLAVARTTAVAAVLLGTGAMVSWTTNVSEIAPAVAVLGRPLKVFGIPVDERAATLALALRSFPMLSDEFRVLIAARRLRPPQVREGRRHRVAPGDRRRNGRRVIRGAVARSSAPSMRKCASNGRKSGYLGMLGTGVTRGLPLQCPVRRALRLLQRLTHVKAPQEHLGEIGLQRGESGPEALSTGGGDLLTA